MSRILDFVNWIADKTSSFSGLEDAIVVGNVIWITALFVTTVLSIIVENFGKSSKSWSVWASVLVTGVTAFLSMVCVGSDGKYFPTYYGTGWYLFVFGIVQFVLLWALFGIKEVKAHREELQEKKIKDIKRRNLLESNIKEYFTTRNPFGYDDTVRSTADRLVSLPDEINTEYVKSIIDGVKMYELSTEDKKAVEEAELMLFSVKGRKFTMSEKNRITELILQIARSKEKYEESAG